MIAEGNAGRGGKSLRQPWTPMVALIAAVCVGCGLVFGLFGARPATAADEGRDRADHRRGDDRDRDDDDHDRGRGDRVEEGREIFRFDTFGDEQNWTDRLRMHEVIEAAVDPLTALQLGLKVDVDALPDEVLAALAAGQVDLTDPATTLALIQLDAVVGIVGTVEDVGGENRLTRVGITCALCHSTVDDSFAAGIGRRLDGWPNLDLDPGAIIAASPAVPPPAKAVYQSWGPACTTRGSTSTG